MAEKTIMLVCSAGMSTSLLVSKMEAKADAWTAGFLYEK